MNRKIRAIVAIILVACISVVGITLGVTYINAEASGDSGRSFTKGSALQMPTTFSSVPKTYEAWIKLESGLTGRGGVIMGTYQKSDKVAFNIEIMTNGNPRLYYNDGTTVTNALFESIDVRTSEWTHLAITHDGTNAYCYIDGSLAETLKNISQPTFSPDKALLIGGDYRTATDDYNMQYFKGEIKQISVYSDVRSASEIAADCTSIDSSDTALLAAYNLTDGCYDANDLSANKYDIISPWADEDEVTIPTDYAYSFMVVGDTQIVTDQHPDQLHYIYDYIVDNVEDKKVKYVFGLGDITDNDTEEEWELASGEIARLDGFVRYSIIRGNHDIYSASKNLGNESLFDKIYGTAGAAYENQYTYAYTGGKQDNFKVRNTIHLFEVGDIKYMNVALDYGADDNVLSWASDIIEQYPYHNVIITTHCYLNASGGYYTDGSHPERDYGESANNGDEIWEKLVSKHPNIVMVLCGHDPSSNIVRATATGVCQNKVEQLLIDPQGLDCNATVSPTGMVATFYISEDGKDVTVTYYSTTKGKYYNPSVNNFSFTLNVIQEPEETYTVSFDANGGSGEMADITNAAYRIAMPECDFTPPFAERFIGWATTPSGDVIDERFIDLTESITLYAKWAPAYYKISFETDGGGTIQPIIQFYNTEVTPPVAPTKQGYVFSGWDKDVPDYMPAEDMTIKAIWAPATDTPYKVEQLYAKPVGRL